MTAATLRQGKSDAGLRRAVTICAGLGGFTGALREEQGVGKLFALAFFPCRLFLARLLR
jgi:hypothetical protein